jgi:hypothetical protein
MEVFSFVTPVTSLDRPNTGKEEEDDYKMDMCNEETEIYVKLKTDNTVKEITM